MTNTLTTLSFVNPKFATGDLTGWSSDPGFIVTTTSFDDTPPAGCTYMAAKGPFGGTPGVTAGSLWQTRDISAYASHIDAGAVTTSGWSVQHAERDDQVDNGGIFMTAHANNDGTGTLLGSWFVLAPDHWPRPGWETIAMAGKPIPVGARSLKLGVTSTWFEGGTNDNQWADFIGPTLETTLPIGATQDFDIAFGGSATLAIAAPDGLTPGAPVVVHNLTLGLACVLKLALGFEKAPRFACAPPPAKAWPAATPDAGAWNRHAPTPPQACEGAAAANDDLDLLSDGRLVTLAGDGLKLVS